MAKKRNIHSRLGFNVDNPTEAIDMGAGARIKIVENPIQEGHIGNRGFNDGRYMRFAIDGRYLTQAAMFAAQSNQKTDRIYFEAQTLSFWVYKGTTVGNINDYEYLGGFKLPNGTAVGQIAVWNGTAWVISPNININGVGIGYSSNDFQTALNIVGGGAVIQSDGNGIGVDTGMFFVTGGDTGSGGTFSINMTESSININGVDYELTFNTINGWQIEFADLVGVAIKLLETGGQKYIQFSHRPGDAPVTPTTRFLFDTDVYIGGTTASEKAAKISDLNNKQDTLVSGTNIKTVNGNSLLGPGNLTIVGVTVVTVPASPTAAGSVGQIAYDTNFQYTYVGDGVTHLWTRTPRDLSSWTN